MSLSHSQKMQSTSPREGAADPAVDIPDKIQVIDPGVVRDFASDAQVWSSSVKPDAFNFRAKFSPGAAAHNDQLCVLWQPEGEHLWLSFMDTDETWVGDNYHFWAVESPGATKVKKDCVAPPALAEVGDILHAVIVESDNKLAHYICDDSDGMDRSVWNRQALSKDTLPKTNAAPAVASIGHDLYLSFQDADTRKLMWAKWTPEDGWSLPTVIHSTVDEYTWGCPGMLILDDQIHVVFSSAGDRSLIEVVFDGATCSSYANRGILTFPQNVSNNNDNDTLVLVCIWEKGSWGPSSGDGNTTQQTCDTPVVAVLNGKAYVLWIPTDGTRILCVISRSLDYKFIQGTWMKSAYDSESNDSIMSLVIPGTHDSCAVGGGVAIKAQNLSIVEQLRAGIRFLDFRIGFYTTPGLVVMYHGKAILLRGTEPIEFNRDVLARICSWLNLNTETVIISVKRDGFGDEDKVFQAVNTIFQQYSAYIYDGSAGFPTLSEPLNQKWAHGKIVVILRTDDTSCTFGFRLPPSQWIKNGTYFSIPQSPTVPGPFFVQDFWNLAVTGYAKARDVKVTWIKHAMSNTRSPNSSFICFTSATGVAQLDLTECPEKLATGYLGDDGINDIMRQTGWTKKVPGIYPMDFPDNPDDLIPTMIALNFPGDD